MEAARDRRTHSCANSRAKATHRPGERAARAARARGARQPSRLLLWRDPKAREVEDRGAGVARRRRRGALAAGAARQAAEADGGCGVAEGARELVAAHGEGVELGAHRAQRLHVLADLQGHPYTHAYMCRSEGGRVGEEGGGGDKRGILALGSAC
jgi:hypothetical protein